MSIKRRRLLGAAAVAPLALAHARPLLAADGPPDEAALAARGGDYVGFVLVPRYFPETGHNVDGELLRHFRALSGVDTFGLPLTEEYWEPGAAGGAGRMVQYFQRARLEYDLDARVVRRSALGDLLGRRQPAVPPAPGIRYFAETGHNVGQGFLRFFVDAGGGDVLGYPISEEVAENGHTVQWFEHARLEWWPELARGRQIQYGLLGAEHLRENAEHVPEAAARRAAPLEPLREWILPDAPRRPARWVPPLHVPIVYYHQVPDPAPLRAQIRAFKEAGRTIVPLAQAVAALRGEAGLPDAPLVLTFDDGWESQFVHAAPVLQAEHVPATFFVITRYLGALPRYMTWDHVRVLKELGHEVESHTQNHPSLDALHAENEGAAVAEIWESLALLEQRLGRSQRLFAYPNGRWNDRVAALVARVYRAAVATGGGELQSQDSLYALRRIKAEPSYPPERLIQQFH